MLQVPYLYSNKIYIIYINKLHDCLNYLSNKELFSFFSPHCQHALTLTE